MSLEVVAVIELLLADNTRINCRHRNQYENDLCFVTVLLLGIDVMNESLYDFAVYSILNNYISH